MKKIHLIILIFSSCNFSQNSNLHDKIIDFEKLSFKSSALRFSSKSDLFAKFGEPDYITSIVHPIKGDTISSYTYYKEDCEYSFTSSGKKLIHIDFIKFKNGNNKLFYSDFVWSCKTTLNDLEPHFPNVLDDLEAFNKSPLKRPNSTSDVLTLVATEKEDTTWIYLRFEHGRLALFSYIDPLE